jgi:hypothetical protein
MERRRYVAELKGEKTPLCAQGRDQKDCDKLARLFVNMFMSSQATLAQVGEAEKVV